MAELRGNAAVVAVDVDKHAAVVRLRGVRQRLEVNVDRRGLVVEVEGTHSVDARRGAQVRTLQHIL